MQPLTLTAILQADDSQKQRVDVPEWGGYVWVRVMSGRQRALLEQLTTASEGYDVRAAVVCATICDAHGAPLCHNAEDIALVADKALEPLQRIFEAARTLNKLGAEAVEHAAGNLEPVQNASGGID